MGLRYLVRSAALTGYESLANRYGVAIAPLLQEALLPRTCLNDPDIMISTEAVRRLLEATAAKAGAPDFGLLLAENRQMSNLGAVALVAREEPTLRAAVLSTARYLRLHNQGMAIRLDDGNEECILSMDFLLSGPGATRQGVELAMGVMARLLRDIHCGPPPYQLVCLVHEPPPSASTHRRVFGTEIAFNSEFNGMVFSHAELDAPLPARDPGMARQLGRHLDEMLAGKNQSVQDNVRSLSAMLMPMGHCTIERVSDHLCISRRTLHRQLAAEGTSFKQLMDDLRADLAVRFIESGNRSLSEVSDLLGFAAASGFSRWFRTRFGCTAQDWRRIRSSPEEIGAAGTFEL